MSDLEREYRRALRRYPRRWRRHHEEALLGVLLDNAEAEGRRHMSPEDRKDLAVNTARLRLARAGSAACFAGALAVLAQTAAVFWGGGGPDSRYFLSIAPSLDLPGVAVYAVCAALFLASAAAGIVLARRNRRRDSAR